MKLGTSLCFTISLCLSLNQASSAQTKDQGARNQPQQNPNEWQYKLQTPQQALGQVWENVLVNGGGQAWFGAVNQGSGMSLASADDALRDHLKLPKGQGLVVTALDGNSPAAHAGIQQNDVLLKLGEAPLGKPDDLEENLKKAGEKPASLSLFRSGRTRVLQIQPLIRVTLGPAQPKVAEHEYWIGVSVSAIEPALRSQLQIPANTGLIVDAVVKDSPAEKAGIRDHDILLDLGQKPLSDDPHKLAEAVQAHGEKMSAVQKNIPIPVGVIRAGGQGYWTVLVRPEQRKTAAVSQRYYNRANSYYFVRPGAVLTEPSPTEGRNTDWVVHALTDQMNNPNQALPYDARNQKPAQDTNAAVSKRLDALDAEIKQLRKAVEALGKAEKTIEELNKAAAALNKAIKDNK